jgi:Flp pilus assembly pilin Flp
MTQVARGELDMRNTMAAAAVAQMTQRSEGQDLLEYGLLTSLIATFVIGALSLMGKHLNDVWAGISQGF